jgi:hypothetical protein
MVASPHGAGACRLSWIRVAYARAFINRLPEKTTCLKKLRESLPASPRMRGFKPALQTRINPVLGLTSYCWQQY